MQVEQLNSRNVLVLKRFDTYVIGLEINKFPQDQPIIEQIVIDDEAWYIQNGVVAEAPLNTISEVSQELDEIYSAHPTIPILITRLTQNFARGQWKPSEAILAEINSYVNSLKERGF